MASDEREGELSHLTLTHSTSGYTSIASSVFDSPQPLTSILSDAGIYSLCGLCALSFHKLFPGEHDREFAEMTMKCLVEHLLLPAQVGNAMRALMAGEGGDLSAFARLLREEPKLNGSCVRVVEDLVLFAVREGVYDARLRVLILYISEQLNVPLELVEWFEESVVEMLIQELPKETDEEVKEKARRQLNKKVKRYLMIGLAGLSGGAIIGLTGGLAAPLVAAGAGALIGGAGAAALGSTAGIAVIGSLFGVAGAGLTGYKMKKRVGEVEEFAFETLTAGRQLHVTIAICGWVTEDGPESFRHPWATLANTREQYAVRWESSYLLELGRAMDYFLSFAVSMAAQEALKFTILSSIIAAIIWPAALVTVSGVIDNPWGVCLNRSAQAGKHLADILIARQQGRRPVTLIGFSLGARVIYYCLLEMSQRKGCEGIIEDAIILGAPCPGHADSWRQITRVVSGRIINGYCRGDWLLKFLYRTSSATLKIAGLDAIELQDRRMVNVDLSEIVSGHMDYVQKMTQVLEAIGVRTRGAEAELITLGGSMRKCVSDIPIHLKPSGSATTGTAGTIVPIRRVRSECNLSTMAKELKKSVNPRRLSSPGIIGSNLELSTDSSDSQEQNK